MPFGIYFIFTTYRAYASLLGVKGDILGTLAGIMNIIGSTCNPIWAFCADRYGFQKIMKIISVFVIILPIYFIIFMDNKIFYVIGLYISCIFRGGVISCITPHIMNIFGLRYYLTLGGFGSLFNQLANFIIAMISILISLSREEYDELVTPYRIVSFIGVIIAVLGYILVFYETDEKFKFDEEENITPKEEETIKEKENKEINEKENINKNEEKKDNEKIEVNADNNENKHQKENEENNKNKENIDESKDKESQEENKDKENEEDINKEKVEEKNKKKKEEENLNEKEEDDKKEDNEKNKLQKHEENENKEIIVDDKQNNQDEKTIN